MTQSTRMNLEGQLPVLAKKIKKFRERSDTIGESNTKAALIDPLLEALGWDITDPDEVCREYRGKPQDNPVDYALLLLGSPRLFTEAKALGKNVSERKWISQTLGYATVVGVEWCVLTNGDEYRIYNAHAPVDVEKKLFRSVRISDPDQTAFTIETLNLLSKDKLDDNLLAVHWKAHFIDRHVNTALEEILLNDDPGLIRLIQKKTPGLKPAEIRDSLRRADIRIDFPIASQDTTPVPQQIEKAEKVRREPRKKVGKDYGVKLIDLLKAGFIHAPLKLQKKFKGVNLEAEIQESGQVVFDGVPYTSLSIAASMARKSVIGAPPGRKYPQTNGWTFWNYYDTEVGALVEIDRPRQQYLKQVREPGSSATNEWRKSQKSKTDKALSSRAEAYQGFFQKLIDILREEYSFTDARVGQPGNWYSFSARLSGLSGITYGTCFSRGSRVRVELYIDKGSVEENRHLFEYLKSDKEQIEQGFGEPFEWEPLDEKRACRIAVYRPGSIKDSEEVLDEILNWAIDRLLKLKEVFEPHLRRYEENERGA